MASDNTIKEFLVALGWQNDEAQQRRFISSIQGATLRAKLLGDVIEETGRKITETIGSAAEDFERLYWLTQQSRVAAKDINALGYAFSQLGSTKDDAIAAISEISLKLQQNPGNAVYAKQFGLYKDAITGQIKYSADMAKRGAGSMNDVLFQKYREAAGLSQTQARILARNAGDVQKYIDEYNKTAATAGFDPKKAAQDGKDFEQAYRTVLNAIETAGDAFLDHMEHALLGPLKVVSDWAKEHPGIAAVVFGAASVGGAAAVAKAGGRVISGLLPGGGLGGSATALTGSATALDASAAALNEAAVALGGGKVAGLIGGAAGATEAAAGVAGLVGSGAAWLLAPAATLALLGYNEGKAEKADPTLFPRNAAHATGSGLGWNIGPTPADLKVQGQPVSSANPLPVVLGQTAQLNAEANAAGIGGGSGGGGAPDTRNWWQRHAPTWAGGKDAPGGGGGAGDPTAGSASGAPVKGRVTPEQAARILRGVGATPQEAAALGALVNPESSGNPNIVNNNPSTGDLSYGLWQVNMKGKLGPNRMKAYGLKSYDDLKNPYVNAKIALDLWRHGGGGRNWPNTYRSAMWQRDYAAAMRGANEKPSLLSNLNPISSAHAATIFRPGNAGAGSQLPYFMQHQPSNITPLLDQMRNHPALGTGTSQNDNSTKNATHNSTNNIVINGSPTDDPSAIAKMIASRVDRANADATRNLIGATQ